MTAVDPAAVPASPDDSVAPAAAPRGAGSIAVKIVVSLALLAASAPLGIDFYLASFPAISSSLDTPPTMVQLTLTGFLWGLGLGQLFWGPISDRFGRRRL